jgi:hypothetical protein
MKVIVRSGTPDTMEEKKYGTPGPAKKYLRGRIMKRQEWAARFNRQVNDELAVIREGVDGIDVTTLPVGELRRWQTTDEHTGTTFVFELMKEYG